jgi:glycosyltransferase involved in cell wall biosynthesis
MDAPVVDLDIRERRTDAEVQATLASADLFVQPSRYEGSSLTTLEAMAHGLKVVATPVGGIPDKVQDGHNGILAKSATSGAIAAAIVRGIAQPAELGAQARATVLERFSSQAAQASYAGLYLRVAAAAESRKVVN